MWEEYNKEKEPWKRVQILKDIAQVQPYLSSYYEATKYVMDKRTREAKEKGIIELNETSLNGQRVNKVPAISVNNNDGETNATTFDKKHDNVNDTSFIDKLIDETADPEVVAHLEKVKKSRVFY